MPIVKTPQFVEDVPPKRTYKIDPMKPLLDELAKHKDVWALIATGEKAQFKVKMDYHYPDYEFAMRTEVENAKPEDPKWNCYARYRGAEYLAERLRKRNKKRKKDERDDTDDNNEARPA